MSTPQEYLEKGKKYFSEMPPEKKKKLGIGAGVVVAFAAVVAIVLNIGKMNYKVLYSGLESTEASTVYAELQNMGASPQMDSSGNIKVPSSKYDECLLQLAQEGYPQSALTYDLFSSHSGLTSTETEKKQWIIYQLQDRIQNTLKQIDGVESSTVTITIPDTSDYIWDQATQTSDSTAGVLLNLKTGTKLSDAQITSIKNLVASSTPKLSAENVTVMDAATMLELGGDTTDSSTASMECEQLAQNQIEENIVRLLMPRYGSGGVVAVAKVKLNYDKMMTEKMELIPQPTATDGTGGDGYTTHREGSYTLNGSVSAGSIVGEENNTDIPKYAYNEAGADSSMTDYSWSDDLDYGYIKTQIEKGNAAIDSATVSVLVDDTTLSNTEKEELIGLISKSTNIAETDIYVSTFDKTTGEGDVPASTTPVFSLSNMPWLLIGGIALGVLVIGGVILLILRRRAAAKERAVEDEKQRLVDEEAERRSKMEEEIANYKKQLSDAASAGIDEKNEAIVKDVRDFAKENPAIAANLLRSWLREGDQE
ncbi:MAG: hypothetical protein LKJ90_09195 [Faecalibacterium sp.]|jgi:flagellar biosynthesis/type III secretory pathway M-ring protein FliF/YscJ|nr:hypothetical protein [Faecalibacterium sp.]